MKKDKKNQIRGSLSAVFKDSKQSATPQKTQIPQIFLQALKAWDKGYVQLKRKAFYEYINLKQRWGFFVLLLMLSDYKTGNLKITTKHLIQVSDLHRNSVYKILQFLHNLKYIIYAPAKNQYHKNSESDKIMITIPNYSSYVKIQKFTGNASIESVPAPHNAGTESVPALKKGGNFLLDLYKTLDERQSKRKSAGTESVPALKKIKPCSSSKRKSAGTESVPALAKNQKSPVRARVKDFKDYKNNNRDVVVNFFDKRFESHQGTLSIKTVRNLTQDHNTDKILTYINRIPNDNSIRNPAGLLYKALNNNWELTPTKKEVLEKKTLQKEKEFKTQKEKDRIERMKFEKAKEEEERLNKVFVKLSKKQQKKLRDKAIKGLKSEYSKISPRVFDSIIATETMIMIKVREMLKKKPKVSKIEKETAKEIEKTFGIPVKIRA